MDKPKNIFILIPDGVGIKNYLYSDVFKKLQSSITLFHNFDEDTLLQINKQLPIGETVEIPKYNESIREKFLREIIHLCRLKLNAKKTKNPSILKFWKTDHRSVKLKLFYRTVEMASQLFVTYKQILNLEKKYDAAICKNPFYNQVAEILKNNEPDVLFGTHQRALKAPTIFAAARDLGIETQTVIYSWDNIPKARLALKADKYLLWSEYMKNEMQLLYPEIPLEKLIVTGTPQFEFYKEEKNILEKNYFYKKYGLAVHKKIICFSGDDVKTSPNDPQYLNDIATAIKEAGEESNFQILFRRCPVDISGRYKWVLDKFPDIIVDVPPLWNFNSEIWSAVYPTFEDVKLLVSIAYYADVVVNVGSTMAFDFGMFHKPCIFINYDQPNSENWSVQTIYSYPHFKSMPTREAVFWLNGANEIMDILTLRNIKKDPHRKVVQSYCGL